MTQSGAPGTLFAARFWRGFLALALIHGSGAGPAVAADALVSVEATVRGGSNATLDQDEVAAGYLHIKYSSPPNLDLARKAIFQFDLTDFVPDAGAPATFQVNFTVSNQQRVQLWGLNQAYPDFAASVTWDSAQANDPNSNELLTAGLFSATRIGTDVLLPTSGTTSHTFTIPRLGDYLFAHQLTLVLAGVADPLNNAGGLRLQLATARLTFTGSNGGSAPALSSVGNQTIWTNTTTGALPFTLTDDVDAASSLVPFATSSNPGVIPVGSILFGGAGSNRTVTITAGSQPGSTLVSIYAVDSQSRTGSTAFNLTVQGTNSLNGEHYDVYLAAGQSNMDGRGAASELTGELAAWSQPQPDVHIFYANPVNHDPLNPTYQTGWQVLRPGWSVPPGFSGALPATTFGPALAFARTVADAAPDRNLALIKVSQGGTSLSSDWKPASGYMYATLTNLTQRALQALTNAGARYTLRGMIWHQGESDGSSSTPTYEARLIEFIAAVRHDLGVSNLPVVVGELATNRSVSVRQAQLNVANGVAWVGFASASNLITLAPDDPHFTARSALIMGQRMAAALEVPPLRFSAVAKSGDALVLTASGLARATAQLRGTTNLASPITHWAVKATKVFDAAGQLTFTNSVLGSGPQEYFLIQSE